MNYIHKPSAFKSFCLFFICMTFLFQSAAVSGQDSSTETTRNASKSKSLSVFLILDSIRKPNQQTVVIFDDSPNYFQMENGEAIITGRQRGKSFLHQGHVEGLEHSTDAQGNVKISFYMVGSEFSNGKIASYEITIYADGSALVHQFVKLDNKVDVYYIAHKASSSEIQAVKECWKGN